jgi:hypothetical protein
MIRKVETGFPIKIMRQRGQPIGIAR